MWRYLVGAMAGLMIAAGGVMLARTGAAEPGSIPPAPAMAEATAEEPTPPPPQASEKTREEKRFARYDKDKDGAVARDEYLLARRKAFAKLDRNGDGRIDFQEYAVKTTDKFGKADGDKSGTLNAAEFATTRVVRKAKPACACPPAADAD